MQLKFAHAFAACWFLSLLYVHEGRAADDPLLTLEGALRRALSVSPELGEARLEVSVREGALDQAGAWPNPSVDLQADEKLGLEDGRRGTGLTQVAVKQPVPLIRLTAQRAQARAQLAEAQETLRYEQLQREAETARALHALQFGQARVMLAQQREAFVAGLDPGSAPRKDRIVRYLTPLERSRLAILREEAAQDAASAQGILVETLAPFRALLALPPDAVPGVVALAPVAPPAALPELLGQLDRHPAIAASDRNIDAASATIDLERARRFADPTIGVFRERDFLNGARRDFSGVTLGVEIPLWNRQSGAISRARAESAQAEQRRVALRRDLEAQLRQSHVRLGQLIEQASRQRERLVAPARQALELARRGFVTGEQNVLTLVDAYDTYFDAEVRYSELLAQGWTEVAELRLAAGTTLLPEAAP